MEKSIERSPVATIMHERKFVAFVGPFALFDGDARPTEADLLAARAEASLHISEDDVSECDTDCQTLVEMLASADCPLSQEVQNRLR